MSTTHERTAKVLNFPNLVDMRWENVNNIIAESMQAAGAGAEMIRTVCERMHTHYLKSGMGERFAAPPMTFPAECLPQIEASFKATAEHYERVNAELFFELLDLEVFHYEQQSPAVAPAGQPRQEL